MIQQRNRHISLRTGNILINIIIFGLLLRVGIAIWNGFFGPSFGADMDALNFHLAAVEYSSNLNLDEFRVGWIYSYVLGIIYSLTTKSLFFGSFLSSIIWAASGIFLIKIMNIFFISKKNKIKILVIYVLLPSSILYTGITLREPYQLFFVNLLIYASLKIYLHKSIVHWFLLFFSAIGMGVLHGALLAFCLLNFGSLFILFALRKRNKLAPGQIIFSVILFVIVVIYGLSLFTNISYNLDNGVGTAVETYQQNLIGTDARTTYKDRVEIDGIFGLLYFAPSALFQYLFEPLPWRISTIADAELFLENSLRAWLIWKTWIGLRKMPPDERKPVIFIFISYLIMEMIWSFGTANWGTAIRHHLPSFGLLLVSAFAFSGNAQRKYAKI